MKLKTKITVLSVAKRWKSKYFWGGSWSRISPSASSSKIIYKGLMSLHATGSENLNRVDKIIGNKSWTSHYCSHCEKESQNPLVSFDVGGREEYNYALCAKCLKKAMKLIKRS